MLFQQLLWTCGNFRSEVSAGFIYLSGVLGTSTLTFKDVKYVRVVRLMKHKNKQTIVSIIINII